MTVALTGIPGMMAPVATLDEGMPMRSEAEFTSLYHARFSDLSAQLYAYVGDASEAQDIVQEAFTRAWQRWDQIGKYEDPVAWVRRVAWNLATSRHRRLGVIRRFLARSTPPENAPPPSPDHVVLITALRRLSANQRRAMVLHYLADMSVADIARECGVAEGTVKSWLHRGRAELGKYLAESEPVKEVK